MIDESRAIASRVESLVRFGLHLQQASRLLDAQRPHPFISLLSHESNAAIDPRAIAMIDESRAIASRVESLVRFGLHLQQASRLLDAQRPHPFISLLSHESNARIQRARRTTNTRKSRR
jgi:hypothetical protein